MESLDPKTRLRRLAESAEIRIDSNIPIRRYYRSGNEMLRMAKVYMEEANMEAAYVLYLKYVTLFLEKIKSHRHYGEVLPHEKKKTTETLKLTLSISEDMKAKLNRTFEFEHQEWLEKDERRSREEEQHRSMQEELNRKRLEEGRRREEMIERDRQFALWTQAQIDQGLDTDNPPPFIQSPPRGEDHLPSKPIRGDYNAEKYKPSADDLSTPSDDLSLPSYAAATSAEPTHWTDLQPGTVDVYGPAPSAPPSFDRSSKPSRVSSIPNSIVFNKDGSSEHAPVGVHRPAIPDRSMKPTFGSVHDQRAVIVPDKLIARFLEIAKHNSDRNIETLGMLGGKLAQNRFTVTHLLIPKQSGKSDRCDLEGHEELGDMYDREDIILVGWIHTHPAYDVFLSSVDMHNQYEYQNMLKEFVAIVCSIKFKETGYLSLTEAGLAEIGNCDEDNFHPHSKDPPLFSVASHVSVDHSLDIIVRDLR